MGVGTTAAWAIYGGVKQWFYTPNHAPSSEAVQPILKLIFPILASAGEAGPHPESELVGQANA